MAKKQTTLGLCQGVSKPKKSLGLWDCQIHLTQGKRGLQHQGHLLGLAVVHSST